VGRRNGSLEKLYNKGLLSKYNEDEQGKEVEVGRGCGPSETEEICVEVF